ncbi:haloalkane dehalogenase [Alteromonas sp. KUL49]|uniref:haloalkane dehalogenase n=1 Tax=Alteromonas sp. KUL49 TaxID=2480798 RepID=UPI00102F0172|nr:haloalkane dehalogenase [Alteromonas sp. KUL49]TAP37334.1 alpha/beta fold hydrolase [Alteromonas sp. KUL49]GEA12960.1 haloalkane dehalogenase [Alteromonas sp. KUL49]
MKILKTEESAFAKIADFPYTPHFVNVTDTVKSELRMAYYQTGPKDGHTVLLLHGEPTWGYLYRYMMPILASAGYNVLVPDLIGFGRSDKPSRKEDYTYARHLIWVKDWFNQVVQGPCTLFCQDWGGLLGLRLVAELPERFAGVMASNTGLPTGEHTPSEAFLKWRRFSQEVPVFPPAGIVKGATVSTLSDTTLAAYNAPFPTEDHKAGARQFPLLVPATPDDPQTHENRKAWDALANFNKPFITVFSDSDPVTAGGDKIMQKVIPGCHGMKHTTIRQGGHFVQEDKGPELARLLVQFIQSTHNL